MSFPLVNVLLSLFAVSQLRLTEVVAEPTQQDQETGVVVERAFYDDRLGNNEDRERVPGDLQAAFAGTGKGWNDEVRRWNDEGEFLAGTETGELRQAGSSRKRGFDSLGGGMIPLKRRLYGGTSNFDSLGGGLILPRKRGSKPAEGPTVARKETLENLAIGVKSRRRFDSLGGGYIPVKRQFDKLGGGMILTKRQ